MDAKNQAAPVLRFQACARSPMNADISAADKSHIVVRLAIELLQQASYCNNRH